MNNPIDISAAYRSINFEARYKSLTYKYYNKQNPMLFNYKTMVQEVIESYKYPFKYYKSESFYRLNEEFENGEFRLDLTMRGSVEVIFYCEFQNTSCAPVGRYDSILQELDSSYDRRDYGLPRFENKNDYELILSEILSIYEDLKTEIITLLQS